MGIEEGEYCIKKIWQQITSPTATTKDRVILDSAEFDRHNHGNNAISTFYRSTQKLMALLSSAASRRVFQAALTSRQETLSSPAQSLHCSWI
jgi:hypothetical protein